jgi:protein-S-isoprenylcysteine O-methyltransferase Ste14
MEAESALNKKHLTFAIVIAVILTISGLFLMFTSVFAINDFLEGYIKDPWYQQQEDYPQNREIYVNMVEALKPIGYICFLLILLLILIGVILKHYKISLLGSYTLYLPLLGQLSFAMTALFAGIGVIRIIWIPIFNIEPEILNLGAIILLPLGITNGLGDIGIGGEAIFGLGTFLTLSSMFVFLILGGFIFAFGVVTWIYGKFQKRTIIDFWIYRYSRHPQYLGLIILNYGLLIIPLFGFHFRASLPTLPWLIVTLIILGLAITEEKNLLQEKNEDYVTWRQKTPFLIPLPNILIVGILFPIRVVLKKDWPENNREVVLILVIYGTILIICSLPLMAGLTGEMEHLYYLIAHY